MVDPYNITAYNLSSKELEERLLFWVCAAGKSAKTAALSLDRLLKNITINNISPFKAIKKFYESNTGTLPNLLKNNGIGCYNHKARTFKELVYANLNLQTCSTDDLEKIYGIGRKTSRCFILHSRENARVAGLDTHILKFLRSKGVDTPKSTPSSKRQYMELEEIFLKYADASKKSVADFDLALWKTYSNSYK